MLQDRLSVRSSSIEIAIGISAFMALALLAVLAAYQPSAPAAVSVDAPLTDFSSDRAMRHLERIARTPHPIGSEEHARVRAYIVEELKRMGLDPEVQQTTAFGPARDGYLPAATVNNIVGVLKGAGNSKAVMLVAHYDSVSTAPGASDDGAGVAAILEIINALKAAPPLKNDVIVLLTDGEEVGLLGARGFINDHPKAKEVGLVLNFEARGSRGPSILFETSGENGRIIREFAKASPYPVGSSLFYELYKRLPNDTDFSVFKTAGLAGLNFAYIDGYSYYHTALDDLESMDKRSLQHHGSYGLALSRHFGNLNLDQIRGREVVYFDILGSKLAHYSTAWVLPIAMLVALAYVGLLHLGLKRKRLTFSGLAAGSLLMLMSAVGVALLFVAVWRLIRAVYLDDGLVTRSEIYNNHLHAISFVSLGAALSVVFFIRFRKKFGIMDLTFGGLCWWVILMVLASLYVPGASYLFAWPLLFVLVALGVSLRSKPEPEATATHLVRYILCAIPGIVLCVPVIRLAFTGLTLKSSMTVLIFAALLWGLFLPLINIMVRAKAWWLPAVLGGLGILLIVAGSLTSGFDRRHPKPNNIFYGLNTDTGKAIWASLDNKPDEWTSQFLRPPVERGLLNEYFAFSLRRYWQSQAVAAPIAGPTVKLLGDSTNDGLRTLHLQIVSPRQAPVMMVHLENKNVTDAIINDRRVDPRFITAFDESKNRWGLRYYGLPATGLDLILTVRSTDPLRFRCVDLSYGLPSPPDIPFKQRPEHMIAAPTLTADGVMVSKSYTF